MKKIVTVLLFSLLIHLSGYAAGPIAHYYFADLWLKTVNSYSKEDNVKFVLGNFFPSISMIGVQTGDQVSKTGIMLTDVYTNQFPFVAGMQLHNFIEEQRDRSIHDWDVYALINDVSEGHSGVLLKLIEDEILYDYIQASEALHYLKKPVEEEVLYAGTLDKVHLWHFYLSSYFSMRPSYLLKYLAQNNKGFPSISPDTIKRWSAVLPQLAADPNIIDYVTQFVVEITTQYEILKALK